MGWIFGQIAAMVPQSPRAARRDAVHRSSEEIADLFDAALLKHKARLPK